MREEMGAVLTTLVNFAIKQSRERVWQWDGNMGSREAGYHLEMGKL
jgi:hypothetical protein